jgi:hypothetical protein
MEDGLKNKEKMEDNKEKMEKMEDNLKKMGLQPRVLNGGGLQIYLWICGFSTRLVDIFLTDMYAKSH